MQQQATSDKQQDALDQKLNHAMATLRGFGRVLVAFSGGVDSTLLAVLARDVLGKERVLAVTADSPSLAREDLAETARLAKALEITHVVIRTREVERPAYRANTEARCYVCKHALFEELEDLASVRGIPAVVYGVIGDDPVAQRPGHRAALQFGVRAPLQEAGLMKWEVRALAKRLELPNWDRPQNACLSSRIPHGQEVTEEKLRQVEAAESFLRARGFRLVRVRHVGAHARIEVEPDQTHRLLHPDLRREVASRFEAFGFQTVGIDRAGYRAGGADAASADEILLTAIDRYAHPAA